MKDNKEFKCVKNLVLGQVIIMKGDIIKVTGSNHYVDPNVTLFDVNVTISDMCEGKELSININQLAEHFEYLHFRTRYTTISHV